MKTLGIDIGTTTISAAIWNTKECNVQKTYTIKNDSNIQITRNWEKLQSPKRILELVTNLLTGILKEYSDISSIGLTGQMHGIVYFDSMGQAVSPLYTWQDQSGEQKIFEQKSICEIIEEKYPSYRKKVYTGYGLVTHLYFSKINQVPKTAVGFCTIMDYLGMRLTKQLRPTLHSSNAASLGFFDVEKNEFDTESLRELGMDLSFLPKVTCDFRRLGEFQKIPVSVAIGDNQASFLASVGENPNIVSVNIGTGGQFSMFCEHYLSVEGIETRPFKNGNYLLVGSSLCGGRAYATLEHFFELYAKAMNLESVDHYAVMNQLLDEQIKSNKDSTERLLVNTTFSGTRENPNLRGSILNIGIDNFTPAALTLGVLDGMANELYEMYLKIQSFAKVQPTKIIASGNGIRKNKHLQRLVSEKFNMKLVLSNNLEEAACGAAIVAEYLL